MNRDQLESAAAEYAQLRGLLAIPLGFVLLLSALGNWRWGPLREDWVFLAGVLVAGAAYVLIARFYAVHYGRVTLSARHRRRAALAAALTVPAVIAGSLLLRSRAGWSLDLPVNPVAASLGLVMLAAYAATVGVRAHHAVICGGLFLAGIAPLWTGPDPGNVGLVMAAVAAIATGIGDHRLLTRALGPPRGLHVAHGDVAG